MCGPTTYPYSNIVALLTVLNFRLTYTILNSLSAIPEELLTIGQTIGYAEPMCDPVVLMNNDADVNACDGQLRDMLQTAVGIKDNEKIFQF